MQVFNPLSANPTKWSDTFKQFVGKLQTNWLSVFDQFVKLVLKGLKSVWPAFAARFLKFVCPFKEVIHETVRNTGHDQNFIDSNLILLFVNHRQSVFPIILKPVNWFAEQNKWLACIWNAKLDWNRLRGVSTISRSRRKKIWQIDLIQFAV